MNFSDFIKNNATVLVSLCSVAISLIVFITSRKQKKIDNLISLQQFLHREDLSEARRYIREIETIIDSLKDPNVRRVCSSFDFAGTMVRYGAVDKELFLDYWQIPLLALEKPMERIRTEKTGETTVEAYYKNFWWLIEQAHSFRVLD